MLHRTLRLRDLMCAIAVVNGNCFNCIEFNMIHLDVQVLSQMHVMDIRIEPVERWLKVLYIFRPNCLS